MTTCESEIKQVAKLQKEIQGKRAELIKILKQEQKLAVEDYVFNFPMVSSKDTSFFDDMGFLHEESEASMYGRFSPGISTFKKHADGKIERIASRNFGPGDDFCVTWLILDLLAEGANSWEAKFIYAENKDDQSCCSH